MGVHLRFGTVSIRQLAGVAHQLSLQGNAGAATWLSELIWRDFYFQILAHFPHVHTGGESKSFRPDYDKIQWHHGKHADQLFEAWCEGRTGYPLVDAAMLQINQSGYMHNRLRMVVASFLCKDLGLDWRRGEAYFALHLNDFELASNNGGWQWASSSGCDAQPYFRIFNPVTQSERFDPEGKFIRRYLPQLAGLSNAAIHCAVDGLAGRAGSGRHQAGRELPEAGGGPCRGAREDAAALRGGAGEGGAEIKPAPPKAKGASRPLLLDERADNLRPQPPAPVRSCTPAPGAAALLPNTACPGSGSRPACGRSRGASRRCAR
jgi:hypothetical protein